MLTFIVANLNELWALQNSLLQDRLKALITFLSHYAYNYYDYYHISFRLELIHPRGGVSHSDPSSPLLSITGMFFLQSERLCVLLFHVPPSLLLSLIHSSTNLFILPSIYQSIQFINQSANQLINLPPHFPHFLPSTLHSFPPSN